MEIGNGTKHHLIQDLWACFLCLSLSASLLSLTPFPPSLPLSLFIAFFLFRCYDFELSSAKLHGGLELFRRFILSAMLTVSYHQKQRSNKVREDRHLQMGKHSARFICMLYISVCYQEGNTNQEKK